MSFRPGLRRVALPRTDEPGDDPVLGERIRAEIAARGPITFARFMELALYDPERGYYVAAADRATRAGDFLTAPETHPIFGAALARHVEDCWGLLDRPEPYLVREYGAGTGSLGEALLRGLEADRSPLARAVRYDPVEADPARSRTIRDRLTAAGFGDRLATGSEPPVGSVLANELLDALPVHRVEGRAGGLVELYVGLDGDRLVDVPGPPSTPALAERLASEGVRLADGQRAEVCLALEPWVAEVDRSLERGVALVVDYGAPAAELYAAERRGGTLLAYVGQRAHPDPYRNVGRQDLTAHVDLTAVERAFAARGWTLLGTADQARFLVGLGLEELLRREQAAAAGIGDWLALRSAIGRLLDPRATGRFRVLAFGKGVPPGARLRGLGASEPPAEPPAGR